MDLSSTELAGHETGAATGSAELLRGWRLILAAAAGSCVGITGLAFYAFGVFVKPLAATFGWSRGQVTLGLTWITLGTILTGPGVGLLIDRFGVRRVAAPSLVGLALGFCLLSRLHGAISGFYIGCFALALMGCGTTPLSWTRAISMRFDRNRGLALGITMLGSAVAGSVGIPLVQTVIMKDGWRSAYLAMAGFIVIVALPLVIAFMGEDEVRPNRSKKIDAEGLTLSAAMRTPPFWLLAFGIMAIIMAQSALTVHLVPLLTDRGLTPASAAGMAGLMGLTILVGRVGIGALLDRGRPALVAGLALALPMTAAILLAVGGGAAAALTAAVLLLGLGAGAEIDFLSYFIGRYFGLRAYGRIYGALFVGFSIGNGLGAPLMGAAFDRYGSYTPSLWAAAAVFGLGAVLFGCLGFYPMFERRVRPIH